MERFQLELINYFTYFPPSSHPTLVFLSSRPFVVNTTGLVGVEVYFVCCLYKFLAELYPMASIVILINFFSIDIHF